MVLSLRKWWERAKFIALFVVLTYIVYHLFYTVAMWMEPRTRFEEPSGRAVKAYAAHEALDGKLSFGERLKFFYWFGE